jgi:diguanylate cyclase (GGDEF)-like protein/PAS domain S-box-containing protein
MNSEKTFRVQELVDIAHVQKLAEANFHASGLPMTMIDAVDDAILVRAGWPGICQNFHRANPRTALLCVQSDHCVAGLLGEGEAIQYKCKNGLWHIAIPIIISGQHMATMFITQFFFQDEDIDREFFESQATKYGFDSEKYMQALDSLPIFSRTKIEYGLVFYKVMARFIVDLAEQSLKVISAKDTLHEREDYQSLVDNINIGVYRIAPTDRFVRMNRAMALMFGHSTTDEMMTLPLSALYQNPADRAILLRELQQEGSILNRVVLMRKRNGETIWASLSASAKFSGEGEIEWIDGVIENVSERKMATDNLRDLSEKDVLTGIYNRRMALNFLNQEMDLAKRYSRLLSVVFFDIDEFKLVNDKFGHDIGDVVLKSMAEVVGASLRKADVFARWGGEEFVIICPETDLDGAIALAEKVRASVASHDFPTAGRVTISAGVASSCCGEGDSGECIVKRADKALYVSKSSGRNRVTSAAADMPAVKNTDYS